MKQLWSQFLFKPELLHHHIQIWILNRAWSPLPSRQSCICATLKQASGAQQPLKPDIQPLTFQQPFTCCSAMKTPYSLHETSSCTDTGNVTDEDSVCALSGSKDHHVDIVRGVMHTSLCLFIYSHPNWFAL